MIFGIGQDMCDIRRVASVLENHPYKYVHRCFTAKERAFCDKKRDRVQAYAKHFCAKEAYAKAVGTGIAQGLGWRDIEVERLKSGQPYIALTAREATRLSGLMPEGYEARVHLTLSDEYPFAAAFVLIEMHPKISPYGSPS